jgi:TrpR-related protein YerC/YecD
MNKNNEFTQLFQAILSIDNIEECKSFFEDICTVQELEKMAQRLEAAKLLLQGQTYEQVIEKTSISSTTLSRVSRCIRYGNGGYKTIINKENNNQL